MNIEEFAEKVRLSGPKSAASYIVKKCTTKGTEKCLTEMGKRHVTKTFTDAYLRDYAQQAAEKGTVSFISATVKATGEATARQTTVNALISGVSKFAGSCAAGPIIGVVAEWWEGNDDYAGAAGRGLASSLAGLAVGTLAAPLGPVASFGFGALASSAVDRRLKQS